MKRTFLCLIAGLSLSACGGGPDFTVKLQDSPEVILADLSAMDPNAIVDSVGLKSIETSRPDGNSILFTLPASQFKDSGTFLFEVKPGDNNTSTLAVSVDLPTVTRETVEGTEYLDEDAIEREVRRSLQEYGRQLKTGSSGKAAVQEAGEWVGYAGVGLQNIIEFEKLAETAAMSQMFESDYAVTADDWSGNDWGDDSSDFAYSDEGYSEYDDYNSDPYGSVDGGGWGEDTQ